VPGTAGAAASVGQGELTRGEFEGKLNLSPSDTIDSPMPLPRRGFRRFFLSPAHRDAAIIALIAMNAFTLLDFDLGVLGPVINAVSTAGIITVGGRSKLPKLVMILPVASFAFFQVLSTIWSLDPGITFKYSLELLYTVIIGLIFVTYSNPDGIIKGILFGAGAVVLVSIASGKQGPSADGAVLIGVLGSKNAMAECSQLVFQCALGVIAMPRQSTRIRLVALAIGAPACFVALTVHASTAIIALVGAATMLFALLLVVGAGVGVRLALLLFLGLAVSMMFLVWDDIFAVLSDFSLRVLKKDSTLTGRTVLWEFARNFISERPILGRGYKEVWLGQGPDTIGLLHWAGITDGRTFYFHETFLDAAVDSGITGAAILALTYVYMFVRMLIKVILSPTVGWCLLFTLATTSTIESFFDNLIQPNSLGTALIFGMAGAVAAEQKRRRLPRPTRMRHRQPAA
jgi:exopolysaccharide production protein ExoQ